MVSSSASLRQDLAFLIVQFLDEHNFTESARMLEKEGKLWFSMKYVEEAVRDGKWKELEDYILSFTKIDENSYSFKMIFEIRRHKYMEALDNGQDATAVDILRNELRRFATCYPETFKEMSELIYLKNIRENNHLARHYVDPKTVRELVFNHLKNLIEINPVLKVKLNHPMIEKSRLKALVNQSLNWSHQFCEYPDANPTLSTLYVDHTCGDEVVLSQNDGDCRVLANLTPCNIDEGKMSIDPEIIEQAQLCSLRLPDPKLSSKIDRLIYNNSGDKVLSLSCTGVLESWEWVVAEDNVTGKTTPRVVPPILHKHSKFLAKDPSPGEHELVVPCFSLSKNGEYVTSVSGGKVSLFWLPKSKTMMTFMSPPPAATSVMFYPEDNNIIIIGMEDGSIHIYDVRSDEVKAKIHAHQKRVTGLAYSSALNILVSSGYDAQICTWNKIGWVKQSSKFLNNFGLAVSQGHTRVQFRQDQKHLLVVHEVCIATFEGPNLNHCKQWIPGEILICDAVYSCDGKSIYTLFVNGQISILDAESYTLRYLVTPSAYLPLSLSSVVYATALAAHPTKHNQFALGLGDGRVLVVQPQQGDWPDSRKQLENVAGG